MKKSSCIAIVLSCIIMAKANAQNIGINNTNPKTSLDINGGLATRAVILTPFANAVNIPDNSSFVEVGPGTAAVTCISSSFIDGQRLVILNKGGYDNIFNGIIIPPNQSREFICRDPGGWTLLSGATANEGWSLKGNAGTDTSVNFIGTKDNMPLRFKIKNENAGLISDINLALGYGALNSGSFDQLLNTAIGTNTLGRLQHGSGNIGIGGGGLERLENGNTNIGIGFASGALSGGDGNILISNANGYSLDPYIFLTDNVIIGNHLPTLSLKSNKNVLLGNNAGGSFIYGGSNVAVGDSASASNKNGHSNVAVGAKSMALNKNGNGAVAIGTQALYADSIATGTIAIGRAALFYNNGQQGNVAIGDSALFNNGRDNLGLIDPTQASYNTAVGNKSLLNNIVGRYNASLGYNAMYSNEAGHDNTAVGSWALYFNKTGYGNTAVGKGAMLNTTGYANTAIGNEALVFNRDNGNTAIGYGALSNSGSGSNNVAIGLLALRNNNGGSNNIAIGQQSGANETGSSKLYIENSPADKNNALIYGDFAADSLLLNAKTIVRNNTVVRGYTKLGGYEADVPSIKMKKMVLTNGPSGFTSPFIHGLTQSKILSVTVLINASTGNDIPPRSTYAGFEYDYYVGTTNIFIKNITGNDASIANRPIKILITYEE